MVMIVFRENCEEKPIVKNWKDLFERDEKFFREEGRKLALKYAEKQNVVLKTDVEDEELCALALGIELGAYYFDKYEGKGCLLETAVLLANNADIVREEYKKYAALANAVRYAKDLFNEPQKVCVAEEWYQEIKRLEYLGLEFKEESRVRVRLEWGDGCERVVLYAGSRQASAVGAALMKVVALQKQPLNITVILNYENNHRCVNDLLVERVIYINEKLEDEEDVEWEFWRLYQMLKEG